MSLHPFCCTVRDPILGRDLFDVEVAVFVEREAPDLWTVTDVYAGGRWENGTYRGGKWMWGGTTMTKHICDDIQQQAQDQLDRQSGRLWELVREDASLMAAE